jgi:hypothetical protein
VEELPMAPSCALDESGIRSQLERYRLAGRGARLLELTGQQVTVQLDERIDRKVIERAIEVEGECCPFFAIDWRAEQRRLVISVGRSEHEPALEAIVFALGLDTSAERPMPD